MLDCHIHIEKGDYTPEWISRFVEKAMERRIDEIWLLEHCYLFPEFMRMYDKLLTGSKKESTLDFYRCCGFNSEEKTAFIKRL